MLLCASVQGLSAAAAVNRTHVSPSKYTGKGVSGDGDEAEADPDREVLLDYLAHALSPCMIHCTSVFVLAMLCETLIS